jgi:pimeloyl-ACP methyl ester carboxylesterase
MRPAAIEALEAAMRLRNRMFGISEYRFPGKYFGPGGIDEAEALCAEAGSDLLSFLAPPARLPLRHVVEAERRGSSPRGPRTIRFDSPLPSGSAENDRVALRLHLPTGGTESGRVVMFHHPLLQKRWEPWDWCLARLRERVPVAMLASPWHQERTPPGQFPGEGYVNPNPWNLFASLRQWSWDQAAARDLLARRYGLETSAVVGFSLGAFQSLLAAAGGFGGGVPVVAIACTNRYAHGIRYGVLGSGMRAALRQLGIAPERFERMTAAIELERYAPRLDGRKVLFIAGRYDRVDPHPSIERLEQALRPERSLHLEAGHATLLLYRERMSQAMEDFLASAGVIDARPETRPQRPRGGP